LNNDFNTVPNKSQLTLRFKIDEKDFLIAGESASKTKKALQQLGLKQEIVKILQSSYMKPP